METDEIQFSRSVDFNSVFSKQKAASQKFRIEPLAAREARLKKLRDWIQLNEARILKAVQQDLGKPDQEVKLSEIRPVIAEIRNVLKNLKEWAGPHFVDTPVSYSGTRGYITYEPKGVTLIMSPWNFPFNLAIEPLVTSLAAGNTAILKPSEKTPHTSNLIAKMAEEVFTPEEVFVFTGDATVAKSLLELPCDHIFFTGSTQVGREVMKAAAHHLSGVTLELGGKSPVIVDRHSNLDDAAERIVWGKFLNCGQTCIAPDYILAEKSIKDSLIIKMKENISRLFGRGSGSFDESSDYGRIVNIGHLERLRELLNDAVERGATLVTGGEINPAKKFVSPTILDNVPEDSLIMQEEIFGPILPVLSYKDLDETIAFINQKPKPLALYIFSSSAKNSNHILTSTSSGTAVINDCVIQFSHPGLPFGGVNHSGMGKSHGFYGFRQFSNEKSVLKQKTGFTTVKMLYPPYRGFVKWWINLVTKYF